MCAIAKTLTLKKQSAIAILNCVCDRKNPDYQKATCDRKNSGFQKATCDRYF
jgi:hypothetical protein